MFSNICRNIYPLSFRFRTAGVMLLTSSPMRQYFMIEQRGYVLRIRQWPAKPASLSDDVGNAGASRVADDEAPSFVMCRFLHSSESVVLDVGFTSSSSGSSSWSLCTASTFFQLTSSLGQKWEGGKSATMGQFETAPRYTTGAGRRGSN